MVNKMKYGKLLKSYKEGQVFWHMPVVPAIWQAESPLWEAFATLDKSTKSYLKQQTN
jgi:hypothetical protein